MNEFNKDHFSDRIDPSVLNESISNDQFFDSPANFEPSHSENILEKLLHLSRFGNLLTLVVGNNGSGKTRLLHSLIDCVDGESQVCHINAQPLLSIDQLFQQVIESFSGEATFTGIPLTANQYEEWAEQLAAVPGNRLLIIDDAEVLSTSVLHELCQLSAMQQAKETPHLHLILFGNYDLNNTLEQAAQGILNEDGIYAIDIPALDDAESRLWLDFLFKQAGVVFLPDEDEFDEILASGQGNLALLKEMAAEFSAISHDINEIESGAETSKISAVGYWFASFSLMIILVLGLFFYQDELIELTGIGKKSPGVSTIAQQPIVVLNASDQMKTSDVDNSTQAEKLTTVIDETESNEKFDTNESLTDLSLATDKVQEESTRRSEETPSESNSEMIISQNMEPKKSDSIEQSNDTEADQSSSFGFEKQVSIEEISKAVDLSNEVSNTQSPLPAQDNVVEQIEPQQTTELAEEKVSEDKTILNAADKLTQSESYLMAEPDSNYVVQLIGLSSEANVKAFIKKYDLPQMLYYRSTLNGKPWFIISLASYTQRSSAQEAKRNLPAELIKNGPWIKQVKTIKGEITKAQNIGSE